MDRRAGRQHPENLGCFVLIAFTIGTGLPFYQRYLDHTARLGIEPGLDLHLTGIVMGLFMGLLITVVFATVLFAIAGAIGQLNEMIRKFRNKDSL